MMLVNLTNKSMFAIQRKLGLTGDGVVACVIDTGVNAVRWLSNRVDYGDDVLEDRGDHGTFVAGEIIEAVPNARILSYCVFLDGKSGDTRRINSALADVLHRKYVNPNRFYIVNMSLACKAGSNVTTGLGEEMHDLIRKLVLANVPVVVAAGNDGNEPMYLYPSCWEEPVCVSALSVVGTRARFSCYHNEVDFCDLGVGVRGILSSGKIGQKNGTSMSTPLVVSKLALDACALKAKSGRWPTEPELYRHALGLTRDVGTGGRDPYYGYGFIMTAVKPLPSGMGI